MSNHYRRIDTTDPRRHDRIQPLQFPDPWLDDSADLYGFLLSSATMMSGAAMITRLPTLSFAGLLFALANNAHDKPHQAKKESAQNATGGPVMGLVFASLSIVLLIFQKLLGVGAPGQPVGMPLGSNAGSAKP